jgi:hypothetical protein
MLLRITMYPSPFISAAVGSSGLSDASSSFERIAVIDPRRRSLARMPDRPSNVIGRRAGLPRFGNAAGAEVSIPDRSGDARRRGGAPPHFAEIPLPIRGGGFAD